MKCNDIRDLRGRNCGNRQISEVVQEYFFPLTKSDGTDLEWDDIDTMLTYFASAVDATDSSDRMYPSNSGLKNFMPEPQDGKYEEFKDGTRSFLEDGAIRYSYKDIEGSTETHEGYISMNGVEMGHIPRDGYGNIEVYEVNGKLRPIPISYGSFSSKVIKKNTGDSIGAGIEFSFDESRDVIRGNVKTISVSELGTNIARLYEPRVTVGVTFSSITTTGAVVFIRAYDERVSEKAGIAGILATDLALSEVGGSSVTVTSLTAQTDNDGYYDLVFPATASATIQPTWSATGYNFDEPNSQTFETPAS